MRLLIGILLAPFLLFSQDFDYSVSSIPEGFGKSANAVIRSDVMEVNIASKRMMRISCKRVVTVLNEAGNDAVMGYVGYDDGIRVKEVSAKVYDGSGKLIKKLKRSDFVDVSAVDGGSLYTDSRVLVLNYFPVAYPYTVEFEYGLSSNNTGTIPNWFFLRGFLVDVLQSRYTISFASPELKPKIKERNFDGYDIQKQVLENSIVYSATNINMVRDEALRPSLPKVMPHVLIAPTNFYYEGYEGRILNWKDAGEWMDTKILSGQGDLPEGTIRMAQQLVAGVEDDLEKARKIFKYVQENTRYISVQVGIGGIKPISAAEVDQLKYGDCKGLSNYTKSLLAAVGVESFYVHVEAGEDKIDFEEDFASLAQGNHVILAVPYNGEYYWLDSTSQTIPFGYIADFTDDRNVLIIKPHGGELQRTKSYIEEQNGQYTTGEYHLTTEGKLRGKVEITSHGQQYGNHYFLETLEQLDIDKYYKKYWSNINNLFLVSHDFNNDKEKIVFKETVEIEAEKYATSQNEKMLFVANAFNNPQYVPPRYRTRNFPFQIQRGFLDVDKYSVRLPEGYEIASLPEGITLDSQFGSYQLRFSKETGDTITLERSMKLNQGYYSKDLYTTFRSFMRKVAKHDKSKIVIHKKVQP